MDRRNPITFPLVGWDQATLDEAASAVGLLGHWKDALGSQVRIQRLDVEPGLVAPLSDLDALREQYRNRAATDNAAVVFLDAQHVAGLPTLKVVLKYLQKPRGMTYVGFLMFPFESLSYVVQVICTEVGIIGIRDATVAEKAGGLAGNGNASHWFQDPYAPTFEAALLRSKADDEEWDAEFPDHPLSRVRATLAHVAEGCEVADELRQLPPFTGPRDLN